MELRFFSALLCIHLLVPFGSEPLSADEVFADEIFGERISSGRVSGGQTASDQTSSDQTSGREGSEVEAPAANRRGGDGEKARPDRDGSADRPLIKAVVLRGLPQRSRLFLGDAHFSRPHHAVITVENRSSMRLSIRTVDADCGCLDVAHDRTLIEQGESFRLTLSLAKSSRLARLRRAIRVFFDESSQPLEIQLDVRVVGDLHLKKTQFQIERSGERIEVQGQKTQPEIRIEHVRSGRGSCLIENDWTQDAETFTIRLQPHFSFGHLSDVLRFRYFDTANRARVVEIPIELAISAPLRFLPSRTSLRQEGDSATDPNLHGDWFTEARMIWDRQQAKVDPEQMQFVVHQGEQPLDKSDYQVAVIPRSTVLWTVACRIRQHPDRPLPTHLQVSGPQGQLFGKLYFSH